MRANSMDERIKCQCGHPITWHGRHGCYAIAPSGACDCKRAVVDMLSALKAALPEDKPNAR